MPPKVLITEPIDPVCVSWLAERCDVTECPVDDPRFDELLPTADALVVRTYTIVDAELLSRAPRLKVVSRAGVAFENIDVAACIDRGVTVTHAPDANTDAVVEYVFALLLDELRPRPTLTEPLTKEQWGALRKDSVAPRQLKGSTLAILGMGRIGKRMATVANALLMNVIYHDIEPVPAPDYARSVSPEDLFAQGDIITVHIDDRAGNTDFVGADLLNCMKPDSIFVNASRGFVVDHAALASFLKANPDARCMLDVHVPEPVPADNPVFGLPNARLLPHIGAATAMAHRNMSWVVRDVWRVLQGEAPNHPAPLRPAPGAGTS